MALTITKSAWRRLAVIQSTRPQLKAVRLTRCDGKPSCRAGRYQTHDVVIELEGHPAVLMTSQVAAELDNQTLHAPDVRGRRRLRFRHTA